MPTVQTSFNFPNMPSGIDAAITAPDLPYRQPPNRPSLEGINFDDYGFTPEPVDPPPDNFASLFESTFKEHLENSQSQVEGFVDSWIEKNSPDQKEQWKNLQTLISEMVSGQLNSRPTDEPGTGLTVQAETAIYNRLNMRVAAEADKLADATYREAADRGFTLPTGAVYNAIQQARQTGMFARATAAQEVAVSQAELEQKNRQYIINTAKELRTFLYTGAQNYMQQVVSLFNMSTDYAKSSFSALSEVYSTKVRYHAAQVDFYKGLIAIYSEKIKALSLKIENYKGELSAMQTQTQVDLAQVQIFQARITAVNALVNMYKAQVDTVISQVDLEKSKIGIFQAQTQAYSAEVSAKNSEWQGYSAKIAGEEAKMRMYDSQAQAFRSRMEGYKTQIEAKIATARATLETNNGKIAGYNSQVQAYNTRVHAESTRSMAHTENNRITIANYEKELAEFHGQTQLELAKYAVENEVKLKNATGELTAKVESARAKSQYGVNIAQLSTSSANVWGQLAGSAMAGANTLMAGIANV